MSRAAVQLERVYLNEMAPDDLREVASGVVLLLASERLDAEEAKTARTGSIVLAASSEVDDGGTRNRPNRL